MKEGMEFSSTESQVTKTAVFLVLIVKDNPYAAGTPGAGRYNTFWRQRHHYAIFLFAS
jgi:hypothetical protein